jgi:hypothetical protein
MIECNPKKLAFLLSNHSGTREDIALKQINEMLEEYCCVALCIGDYFIDGYLHHEVELVGLRGVPSGKSSECFEAYCVRNDANDKATKHYM